MTKPSFLAVLLAASGSIANGADLGTLDDSLAMQWHFDGANSSMKKGHRQVREWRARNDSLRRQAKSEIYGTSSVAEPTGKIAGRSLAGTASAPPPPLGTEHSFAEGRIKGQWQMVRISNTTAAGGYGSGVRLDRTAYDSLSNTIHALSTEGNLVSAPLVQMGSWVVRNQVVQIDPPSFVGIQLSTGDFRLLGIVDGGYRFSDDDGLTWTISEGGTSSNGAASWAASLPSGEVLAVVRRGTYDVLIRSRDDGASFQELKSWPNTTVRGAWLYNTADQCFIVRKRETGSALDVYKYASGSLSLAGSIGSGAKPTSVTGTEFEGKLRVYVHLADSTIWSSTDGSVWSQKSKRADALQVVVPDQPDVLFSNSPQHDLSKDGGVTWAVYQENNKTIGWDPKHLAFYRVNGVWTLLAANDMGLCFNPEPLNSKTWRYVNRNHTFGILHGGTSVDNTALTLTANQDPGTFELTRTARDTFLATNRYAADGLRSAASNNGTAYWYRHYWAAFYHAHASFTGNTKTASFNVDGDWYSPPFKGSTIPGEDAIWVSGWDKLFKLVYSASSNTITRRDLPKDFRGDAGAVTMGVGVSKSDPSRMYAATRNGKFFWSRDTGKSWTETTYSGTKPAKAWADWGGASGFYIEVSESDPDLVFWGGGTGSAACLVSRDGGKTFQSTVGGLPSGAEVRNVSLSPDGKLAFSSNFFVWIASDNKWYDLRSPSMPSAALPAANSVQYLPLQNKVRYFTWGAGVVDLDITFLNTADHPSREFDPTSCFKIQSVSSGKFLTATSRGAAIQTGSSTAQAQRWKIVADGAFHRISNSASGKWLQVDSSSFRDGASVGVSEESGGDHQEWNLVPTGDHWAIVARHSVKALVVPGASSSDSLPLTQAVFRVAPGQIWDILETDACAATPVRHVKTSDLVRLQAAGQGRFRIEGVEGHSVHALVWDHAGRVLVHGEFQGTMDLSHLPRGLYHVRLWSGHVDAMREVLILP
ncbi:MAG: RICIN domain-containing protein [Fibrobacteria bacterium]|nr:RICIN domain-containing protein [Fibrobacteria bacterium]